MDVQHFSMGQSEVSKHYSDVADRYDQLYGFTYNYFPTFAIKHLQLKPDDLLADIGGGTGTITHLIWKEAGLTNPALCVEPSVEMLQIAESHDGLKPCCATADEFFTDHHKRDIPKCNKILMNESAHLFPDLEGTLRKAHEYLPVDGLLVLIARSTQSTLPVWKSLDKKFTTHTVDEFRTSLVSAGFNVQMVREVGIMKMAKREWYDKLRRRILTSLYEFSDEQIEEGIKELDQEWFPGKKETDIVDFRDSLQFYIATKS